MFKKISSWIVYAGFVGLLIFGGVIRTEAKANTGVGEGKVASESLPDQDNGQEKDGYQQGRGIQSEKRDSESEFAGDQVRESITEGAEHDWNTFEGSAHAISEEVLDIEIAGGEHIVVEGRAWKFALDNGFTTETGNLIQLSGFFEDGEFKVSWILDLDTNSFVEVRDPSGRPFWAGGRGQG